MKLVLDWDGTVTEVDSLHLVLLEFGDPETTPRALRARKRVGGQLSPTARSSTSATATQIAAPRSQALAANPAFS